MFASKSSNLSLNLAIVLALLAPAVILYLAFTSNAPQRSASMAMGAEAVGERIRPVVTLDDLLGSPEEQNSGAAVAVAKTPEALYQGACLACHASGVANAPKLGDKTAWAPKAALGIDALLNTAITGKGAMPPKGGSAYSEDELRSVIEYMLAEAGF